MTERWVSPRRRPRAAAGLAWWWVRGARRGRRGALLARGELLGGLDDLHLVADLQVVEPGLGVDGFEVDAAPRRPVGAAAVERDPAVLEEHRPRHRGGLPVREPRLLADVVLLLAVHPQRVPDRRLLAVAAGGDLHRPAHDLAVLDQPGALRVEVDAGLRRDRARGARDERLGACGRRRGRLAGQGRDGLSRHHDRAHGDETAHRHERGDPAPAVQPAAPKAHCHSSCPGIARSLPDYNRPGGPEDARVLLAA